MSIMRAISARHDARGSVSAGGTAWQLPHSVRTSLSVATELSDAVGA
jgi:hypothetical protein